MKDRLAVRSLHSFTLIASLALVALAPAVCLAQVPYDGVVTIDRGMLHVRAGDSEQYYRTSGLNNGDRVKVLGAARGGWLAIEPPPDSFSWISSDYVREISKTEGEVIGNNVNVRIGTLIDDKLRDYTQIQLQKKDRVQILDRRTEGEPPLAKAWYKIAPPRGEVRFVDGRYIQPADGRTRPATPRPSESAGAAGVAGNETRPRDRIASRDERPIRGAETWNSSGQREGGVSGSRGKRIESLAGDDAAPAENRDDRIADARGGPAGGDPLDRANAAYKAELARRPAERDFATARRLYQTASKSARSDQERAFIEHRLEEITDQEARKSQATDLERMLRDSKAKDDDLIEQTRRLREKDRSQPEQPRYDGSGVLRATRTMVDGKPAFALVSPTGSIRYYVTPRPGLDLAPYVDHTIAVRGTSTYRAELRGQHILVRDVMPLDPQR